MNCGSRQRKKEKGEAGGGGRGGLVGDAIESEGKVQQADGDVD